MPVPRTIMHIQIGTKRIGPGQPVFIIAEIGINHNGSVEIAKQLIDAAVAAGCDAVKLQKRNVRTVYTQKELEVSRKVDSSIIRNAMARIVVEGREWTVFPDPEMVRRFQADENDTTNGMLKYALEFTIKDLDTIDSYCREVGIPWSASSWDGMSAHEINGFNPLFHKIASACLTHADLLRRVRSNGKPVILSTGGSTMDQIARAVEILGKDDLILMHCVANYPSTDDEANLNVIKTLRHYFPGVPVGYSGHEADILPSVLAVALGACVVERHITLSKRMPGSDHAASLEPEEFRELVQQIRRVERLRGDGMKRVLDSEVPVMKKLRRKDTLFE